MKNDKPSRILVVAPHGDDEILGCGATILKHRKSGDEVYVCIVTKPHVPQWSKTFIKNRDREIAQAHEILGIKQTFILGFPAAELDTIPNKKLNEAIKKIFDEVNPEVVYAPHAGDLHRDHRLVFEAVLVGTRPRGDTTVKKLLCYETVSETEWGYSLQPFVPNVFVAIDKELPMKIQAMKAYRSEIRKFPHPRSLETLQYLARKRGSEIGRKAAEAFMLIRETN